MKTAIRRNILPSLATAALLFGFPRPAAGQTMDAGDHSQAAAQGESVPVVSAPVAPASRKRLPIFGVMADVGLPDGIIGSLAIRPLSWVRLCAGGGSNLISSG